MTDTPDPITAPMTYIIGEPPKHLTYWRWAMEPMHADPKINHQLNERRAVAQFIARFGVAPTTCFVGAGWIGLAPVPEGMTK